jgi:hypothetical protein
MNPDMKNKVLYFLKQISLKKILEIIQRRHITIWSGKLKQGRFQKNHLNMNKMKFWIENHIGDYTRYLKIFILLL